MNSLKGTILTGKIHDEPRLSDRSAFEIARELKYNDICTILAPVPIHELSAYTMSLLEVEFHNLLRSELQGCGSFPPGGVRLPSVAALTELEYPEMWFPLEFLRKVRLNFQKFTKQMHQL